MEDRSEGANELRATFDRLRRAAAGTARPGYRERRDALITLQEAIRRHSDAIAAAVNADYGSRSRHETLLSEVALTISNITYTRRRLKRWMRPERRTVAWPHKPARARVLFQPLGVVGVISPWNYPFALAMIPLIAALAAGNRVLLKPSEITPKTAALLRDIVAEACDPDFVQVLTGGAAVGEVFSRLPFDHLFFTGSTSVGRAVLRAASENLTPVTLELGGKSPVILSEGFPLDTFADRVAGGKLFNAGQTCIAPDYVLAPAAVVPAVVAALGEAAARFYPTLGHNPDYTAIINDRHLDRLRGYLTDAAERGATLTAVNPAGETGLAERRKLPPTIVTGVTDDMLLMQDEIFGPILPVRPYESIDDAVAYVNARTPPLALYLFDHDKRRVQAVLARTRSGGVCVNDTILHTVQDDLPFGGVGSSGMGAYHGKEGFETFSHKRAVLYQSRFSLSKYLRPPYGAYADRVLKFLLGRSRSTEPSNSRMR